MTSRTLLFLCLAVGGWAQRPLAGFKAGVPVSAICTAESLGQFGSANVCGKRYLVGPAVEWDVAGPLSLDFAALFTRVRLRGGARSATIYPTFATQRTGTSWEFPLVGKVRLGGRRVAPFVGAGPTFRRISHEGENTTITQLDASLPSVTYIRETRWQAGIVVGGGIAFRAGAVRISLEVRYSRFASGNPCVDCGPFALPLAKPDATVVLLGVHF